MNTIISNEEQSFKKFYSINSITLASLLGGPLSAFYLISKNFKALDNTSEYIKNLFYGWVSTVILFSLLALFPNGISQKIPHQIMPMIYTVLLTHYANKLQGKTIKAELSAGARKNSTAKVICISIISLVISAISYFTAVLVFKSDNMLKREIENNIGVMFHQGHILPQNDVEAAKWWRYAAEHNDPDAQNNLGVVYHLGKGVPQNDEISSQWYLKSAQQGNINAELSIAYAYRVGIGVPQNYAVSMSWIRKAAEQGNVNAQYILGASLHFGYGVPQDDSEAIKWLLKAKAQGDQKASNLLQLLSIVTFPNILNQPSQTN